MEFKNLMKRYQHIVNEADYLGLMIGAKCSISFNEEDGYYVIDIRNSNDELLYCSSCDTLDELDNEVSTLLCGAKLAKGIEV